MGGNIYSLTTLGLNAQYKRNGALTTGMITWNSIPRDCRTFCVDSMIFTLRSKLACGNVPVSSSKRSPESVSCEFREMVFVPMSKNRAAVTGPAIGIRYSRLLSSCVSPPGKMIW